MYSFNATNISTFYCITGKASVYPQPLDTEKFIRAQMYDANYTAAVPPVYAWPHSDRYAVDMI